MFYQWTTYRNNIYLYSSIRSFHDHAYAFSTSEDCFLHRKTSCPWAGNAIPASWWSTPCQHTSSRMNDLCAPDHPASASLFRRIAAWNPTTGLQPDTNGRKRMFSRGFLVCWSRGYGCGSQSGSQPAPDRKPASLFSRSYLMNGVKQGLPYC